jgi:hypothetical protein
MHQIAGLVDQLSRRLVATACNSRDRRHHQHRDKRRRHRRGLLRPGRRRD